MEAYIQMAQTGQYLKEVGLWVEKREEAMTFKSALTALDFCEHHNLKEPHRIVLAFSKDQKFDITFPPRQCLKGADQRP